MPDLSNKSIEELEDLMQHPEKLAEVEEEPTAPAPEPEPEPEVAPVTPEPPAAEPEPTPSEPEPEVDEVAVLRAEMEAERAARKKMESQLGKFAGEADYWRRKAETVKSRPEPEPEFAPTDEPEEKPRPSPAPKGRDEIAAWAISQAMAGAAAQFEASHPDAKELAEDMKKYWVESQYDPSKVLEAEGPLQAAKEVSRALEEAYWHANQTRLAAKAADLAKRRADQFSRQKEAKQRASISASGSAPSPKATPKTLNEMSKEELDAEMRRLTTG